jgi:DNA-nicking Smr family endonuclease
MHNVAPLRRAATPVPERRLPAGPLEAKSYRKLENKAGKMPALPNTPVPSPEPLDRFAGVDRATADRVKRGRYPVTGRLDLHGMTQAEAHRALIGFVTGARAAGKRCVLVITGHGRASGGVLKASVPRWLAEPELRRHVLAITPAQPQHGGDGALYLLLKRPAS